LSFIAHFVFAHSAVLVYTLLTYMIIDSVSCKELLTVNCWYSLSSGWFQSF